MNQADFARPIEYEAMWSVDRKAILYALYTFQQGIGVINKTQTATIRTDRGNYEYTFADLNDTIKSVLPLLKKLGLYLDWGSEPSRLSNGTIITCTVFHVESGEWKSVTLPAFHEGSSQKLGAALSFTRRYAVNVLLGLQTEDPDANIEGQALYSLQKLKDEMVPKLLTALEENDHMAVREITDSLQTWEYKAIWDEFNSKQKGHITEMIQRARIAAGDSEPLGEIDQKRADRMQKEREK